LPAKPRADRSLPTGTVTFLFTDIEGSTRLWETQHAAMQLALAHHDAIICDAIEGNDGYLAACCCRQMSGPTTRGVWPRRAQHWRTTPPSTVPGMKAAPSHSSKPWRSH
jgi:class 3 adenylate cyclase